jgi:organic hydroperoxide reductase OsmC/OhrA
MTVEFEAGTAQKIVEAAGQVCPRFTALRGNVAVALVIDSEPELI